jgi:hypothetical protein
MLKLWRRKRAPRETSSNFGGNVKNPKKLVNKQLANKQLDVKVIVVKEKKVAPSKIFKNS